jgi:hypothetical protein
MRALQKELNEVQQRKACAKENKEDLEILRERCERLERMQVCVYSPLSRSSLAEHNHYRWTLI